MERVHSRTDRSFDEVELVGVTIGLPDENNRQQSHVGILYWVGGEICMLHLAWHHKLRQEPPPSSFLWIDPPFHSLRLEQVAATCRKIWRANREDGIPYAFDPPSDCFDSETRRFLFGDTRIGLTCSTFVLSAFHAAGLQLVHYDSWPLDRPGDREWQEWIVELLRRKNAPDEHIAKLEIQVGFARYRPEDTAAAALQSQIPALFETVQQVAIGILDRVRGQN
jgi:hypothetical protein